MRQGIGRIGIALLAALVLVLQSAFAVAATPVQRDIFGNVICTEGGGVKMPAGGGHDGGRCARLLHAFLRRCLADGRGPAGID